MLVQPSANTPFLFLWLWNPQIILGLCWLLCFLLSLHLKINASVSPVMSPCHQNSFVALMPWLVVFFKCNSLSPKKCPLQAKILRISAFILMGKVVWELLGTTTPSCLFDGMGTKELYSCLVTEMNHQVDAKFIMINIGPTYEHSLGARGGQIKWIWECHCAKLQLTYLHQMLDLRYTVAAFAQWFSACASQSRNHRSLQ